MTPFHIPFFLKTAPINQEFRNYSRVQKIIVSFLNGNSKAWGIFSRIFLNSFSTLWFVYNQSAWLWKINSLEKLIFIRISRVGRFLQFSNWKIIIDQCIFLLAWHQAAGPIKGDASSLALARGDDLIVGLLRLRGTQKCIDTSTKRGPGKKGATEQRRSERKLQHTSRSVFGGVGKKGMCFMCNKDASSSLPCCFYGCVKALKNDCTFACFPNCAHTSIASNLSTHKANNNSPIPNSFF